MIMDMRLTSRSEPGPEPEPGTSIDGGLESDITGLLRYRRLVIRVLMVIFLLLPALSLLFSHHKTAHPGFLVLATLAFVVLTDRTVLIRRPRPGQYERWQWLLLPLLVALGAALFAVGGMAWLSALAVASAGVGRITPDGRASVIGLASCTGIAVVISDRLCPSRSCRSREMRSRSSATAALASSALVSLSRYISTLRRSALCASRLPSATTAPATTVLP